MYVDGQGKGPLISSVHQLPSLMYIWRESGLCKSYKSYDVIFVYFVCGDGEDSMQTGRRRIKA
jgi:hypothetical protein